MYKTFQREEVREAEKGRGLKGYDGGRTRKKERGVGRKGGFEGRGKAWHGHARCT